MFSCECPMLEKAKNTHSLTWCHCAAGYNKKLFEIVLETPIDMEIIYNSQKTKSANAISDIIPEVKIYKTVIL